jgi:HK97 family phage portal protein
MFDWLARLFSPTPATKPREQALHLSPLSTQTADFAQSSVFSSTQASHAYEQSAWVYVAINRITEAAALVPLHVYEQTAQGKRALPAHPMLALLNNPNPYTSCFELLEQTLGNLELHGNAYWYIVGDTAGKPKQLWNLRPDRVSIVPDPRHYVRGYVYELEGQRIALEALEVVHFKRWHPRNDYYGLSALSAARLAVQADGAMAEWNRASFGRDYGVPAGIVNIKQPIGDLDFERLKAEWRSSYGTGQRRTAFLRGGEVEWVNIGLSHSELDFLQGRKAQRDEILSIFGIPLGLLDANATEANATVAERQFIERTLYPKLVRMAQKISQDLLPFWQGQGQESGEGAESAEAYAQCVAEFEDIRPTDARLRLEEIRTAAQFMSVAEIRARYYDLGLGQAVATVMPE